MSTPDDILAASARVRAVVLALAAGDDEAPQNLIYEAPERQLPHLAAYCVALLGSIARMVAGSNEVHYRGILHTLANDILADGSVVATEALLSEIANHLSTERDTNG